MATHYCSRSRSGDKKRTLSCHHIRTKSKAPATQFGQKRLSKVAKRKAIVEFGHPARRGQMSKVPHERSCSHNDRTVEFLCSCFLRSTWTTSTSTTTTTRLSRLLLRQFRAGLFNKNRALFTQHRRRFSSSSEVNNFGRKKATKFPEKFEAEKLLLRCIVGQVGQDFRFEAAISGQDLAYGS